MNILNHRLRGGKYGATHDTNRQPLGRGKASTRKDIMNLQDTPELFDWQRAQRLKEQGMESSALINSANLINAQMTAILIAKKNNGYCNADMVQKELMKDGIYLGNAAGSIFRGKNWKCTGWIKSQRITNHCRFIRVWQYVHDVTK